ncbi:MAG TPA: helix-hairpin-helix domain-containing protein, partial [Clostridia bacterium]
RWLSDKRSSKVHIKVPRRGEKLQMLEMVSQNAKETLEHFKSNVVSDHNRVVEGLSFLSEITGLKKPPFRIEAYDISNTGSTEIVASMVVFENGKLNKNEYRRFKMKSNITQNDYGSMQETIFRRFNHALKENEDGDKSSFSKMPDIILVDGGLGHVNAVSEVIEEFKLNIPILGMVKDDNHRTRGLVSKENEFDLRKNLNLLRMITGIQDEAHRFAVEYNRKLREKRYRGSVLDEIDGIGPKRKKSLIKHFGSVSRIKEAEIGDLLQADGMTRPLAEKIYEYFH